jgi:hypothetical protein
MAATNVKKGDRYICRVLVWKRPESWREHVQFAGASKVSMTGEVKITAISNLKGPVIDFFCRVSVGGLGNKIKLLAQAIQKYDAE